MMNKPAVLLFFFSLLSFIDSKGFQSSENGFIHQKDSINALIANEDSDERKTDLLFQLASIHFYSNELNLGLKVASKAYKLADSIRYTEFKASHHFAISTFFGQSYPDLHYYFQQNAIQEKETKSGFSEFQKLGRNQLQNNGISNQQLFDQLKKGLSLLSVVNDRDFEAAISFKLGHLANIIGNPEEALDYFEASHRLFNKSGLLFPAFHGMAMRMSILYTLDRHNEVREIERELKSLLFKHADDPEYGLITKAMASAYARQGRFIMSIEFYLKSIEFFTLAGDATLLPDLYRDLGIAYENLYLFDKSVESFKKCIETLKKIGNYDRLSELYIFMVFPLIDLEKYDEA